jgi:hypothetical protein
LATLFARSVQFIGIWLMDRQSNNIPSSVNQVGESLSEWSLEICTVARGSGLQHSDVNSTPFLKPQMLDGLQRRMHSTKVAPLCELDVYWYLQSDGFQSGGFQSGGFVADGVFILGLKNLF